MKNPPAPPPVRAGQLRHIDFGGELDVYVPTESSGYMGSPVRVPRNELLLIVSASDLTCDVMCEDGVMGWAMVGRILEFTTIVHEPPGEEA